MTNENPSVQPAFDPNQQQYPPQPMYQQQPAYPASLYQQPQQYQQPVFPPQYPQQPQQPYPQQYPQQPVAQQYQQQPFPGQYQQQPPPLPQYQRQRYPYTAMTPGRYAGQVAARTGIFVGLRILIGFSGLFVLWGLVALMALLTHPH